MLKAVLAEQFQVHWKIDAVVGGGGPAPAAASSYGSYSPPAPAYTPPAAAPATPAAPPQPSA
ncbi:hypothetical protein, partial [Streptomyces sp. WAC06614]|uniref:hypothetical protein n=1 Tax=Streptomyces sp. WAC06614 TaxID=2487416 RepID=UPI0028B07A07